MPLCTKTRMSPIPVVAPPIVTLKEGLLAPGWQEGHINFTATGSGPAMSDQVLVRAYLGPVDHVYLPLIRRQR